MQRWQSNRIALRTEDVIQVSGRVAPRLPGTENPKLATGDIEVLPAQLTILNRAENLPFQLDAELSNEDLELTYRYFDLRRPRLSQNLRTRHRVTQATRQYLDAQGFSKSKLRFFRRAHQKARAIFCPEPLDAGKILRHAAGAAAIQAAAHGRRASKNIFRSRNVFGTRICGPIASRNLPKSISKPHSLGRKTFTS